MCESNGKPTGRLGKKKTAFLSVVQHAWGSSEQTVAVVRANKDGTRAVVEFIGGGEAACFQTVRQAWDWLRLKLTECQFFEPTESYPREWKKNFV